jgi:phosphate/sulfate permease
VEFSKRLDLQFNFFEQDMEIHWLSILNSFVLVTLLTGFIAIIILRVLRSDIIRYTRKEEEEEEDGLIRFFFPSSIFLLTKIYLFIYLLTLFIFLNK